MKGIKKPIVIVGAGFAGITTALHLKNLDSNLPIIVIDSKSKFIFKPLMYEVLSNEIKSWEVEPSFNTLFASRGITFVQKELLKINLTKRSLFLKNDFEIQYEYLFLCTGSIINSYSIKGVNEYCHFFNDMEDLNNLRIFLDKPLNNLDQKNLFIIGAGPSGIELACKISDIYNKKFKISVIERSNEILSRSKIFNREEAEKALEKRDIQLFLGTSVKQISEEKIEISNSESENESINYKGIIWTAGVKPNLPIFEESLLTHQGRILVNDRLQLESFKDVFVLGDISFLKTDQDIPLTAQSAMQQGIHASENLYLSLQGKPMTSFEFQDNGEMISLGVGNASIAALGITFSGEVAFEIRRLIYASKMPILEKSIQSAASWLIHKKNSFYNIIKKFQ